MGPELAPWNYSPGINPNVAAAIEVGYLIKKLNRQRLAIIADPSVKDNLVKVVRRVAAHLKHPIPADCVVLKKAQEASSGMRSEITAIRTCYGAGQTPDAVVALDALNAVFGAMEAKSQGWRGADNNVVWDCTGLSCWITTLAELCDDACRGDAHELRFAALRAVGVREEVPVGQELQRLPRRVRPARAGGHPHLRAPRRSPAGSRCG